jgi:hypothetical protein
MASFNGALSQFTPIISARPCCSSLANVQVRLSKGIANAIILPNHAATLD